jgi:hypothetical protein
VTLQVGARVRVINHGQHDGKVGTVTSTNGYIIGVTVDDGPTAPLYATEVRQWLSRRPRED